MRSSFVKLRGIVIALLMPAWLCSPLAQAAPTTGVQVEIGFLLGYVEGSGCEFYRNGTWSSSQAAQAHLRDKYKYLVARGLIDSTEQFIERAATQSSLSGQAYRVRCHGGPTLTSGQWLHDELARLRTYQQR
jgi:hypothetical protein